MAEENGSNGATGVLEGMPTSIKQIAVTRKDVTMIAFKDVAIVEGWNVRDMDSPATKEHIDWLYQNIFVDGYGMRDPWRGYFDKATGKFNATAGHCRHAATLRAIKNGLVDENFAIPTMPEDKGAGEIEKIKTMLLENSGLPLEPWEKARVFLRLNNLGMDIKEIAKLHNPPITRQQADNIMLLAHATPWIIQQMKTKALSPTTVQQEIKAAGDADKAEAVLRETISAASHAGVKPTGDVAAQVRRSLAAGEKITQEQTQEAAQIGQLGLLDTTDDGAPAGSGTSSGSGSANNGTSAASGASQTGAGASSSSGSSNGTPAASSGATKGKAGKDGVHTTVLAPKRRSAAEKEAALELRDLLLEVWQDVEYKVDGKKTVITLPSDVVKKIDALVLN